MMIMKITMRMMKKMTSKMMMMMTMMPPVRMSDLYYYSSPRPATPEPLQKKKMNFDLSEQL